MRSGPSVLALRPGLIVRDEILGREYRIETLLRHGGFGTAYLATRLSGKTRAPALCVVKVTLNAAAWHSEAYFGHLLRHVPALVEVYDSFAWAPGGGRTAVAEYGLVLRQSKFAAGATLDHALDTATRARGGDRNGYRAEFLDLVRRARDLSDRSGTADREDVRAGR